MDRKTKENLLIAADIAEEKQKRCERKYHRVFCIAAAVYIIHIMMVRFEHLLPLGTGACDLIEGALLGIALGCLLFGSCVTSGYLDAFKQKLRKKWQ